uniref:Uncharacterized protein n=1 Tax=Rhizophora mucronata TaxID=61149 RepID=A0A2P2NK89_RHIMU
MANAPTLCQYDMENENDFPILRVMISIRGVTLVVQVTQVLTKVYGPGDIHCCLCHQIRIAKILVFGL